MTRPVIFVLAGVNGAGKSSIGGHLLKQAGADWFNPDAFAKELKSKTFSTQFEANAEAWQENVRRLDLAVRDRRNYAFETTLGGQTIARKLRAAATTHDVIVWFCGLASPDLHIRRVRARVAAGGHEIPEPLIRARVPKAIANMIALLPVLAHLQVYDNSVEAGPDGLVPDPLLVMEMAEGVLVRPSVRDTKALARVPDWAKPIVEAAMSM